MAMPEKRSNVGPRVVLAALALFVFVLFAFGTVHNWFAFATGQVYLLPSEQGAAQMSAVSAGPSGSPGSAVSPNPSDANTAGYAEGFSDGKRSGYEHGLAKGKKAGYKRGYAVGHKQGYNLTEHQGYAAGYPVGVDAGRRDGQRELQRQYWTWKTGKHGA
jgi:hypothetical protein